MVLAVSGSVRSCALISTTPVAFTASKVGAGVGVGVGVGVAVGAAVGVGVGACVCMS